MNWRSDRTDDLNWLPQIAKVQELFRARHRFSAEILDKAFDTFGLPWARAFEETLQKMFPDTESLEAAVRGYAAFAFTSLRLQARFEKTGEYENKSYADASDQVYYNDEYMNTEYLPGLFLSHYLWPHHYRQIGFFRTAFLPEIAAADVEDFAEVGVGTGLYSRLALQALPRIRGVGVDISPSSKRFAERHMEAFGLADRYEVRLQDLLEQTESAWAASIICVEVLEHLEDPILFLKALKRALRPGGRAFVTAAINAAHTDHIYLYRAPAEVERQLLEAGFDVEQYFAGYAYKPLRPDLPVPVAAAFVVA